MVDEVSGILELDASDFISETDDASSSMKEFDDEAATTQDTLFEFDAAGAAAGLGIAAVGGAIQGVIGSTQDWRESLGRTSVGMGISQDATEDLARSLSDATFPMDDVVGTMDELVQIGVDSEEDMERYALAIDDIADATDTTASSIAENLAPAVQGLDGDLEALEEEADAFVLAARESQLSIEEVSSVIERLDFDELEEMGLRASDTAGLIAEFADETGFSGQVLRTEFNKAMNDADGDLEAFTDNLGLGDDAMADWNQRLEDADGITQEYADAANDSVTTMDRIGSMADDLRLQFGGMLGPVDALGPALMGVGGAATVMSQINTAALIPSITGIVGAIGPLVPVLLLVGAIIAGLALAWREDFAGIQGITEDVFATVQDVIETVVTFVWEDIVEPIVEMMSEWWAEHGETIEETVEAVFGDIERTISSVMDALDSIISPVLRGISLVWDRWGDDIMRVVEVVAGIIETVIEQALDTLVTVIRTTLAIIRGDWSEAWGFVSDFLERTIGRLFDIYGGLLEGTIEAITSIKDAIVDGVRDALDTAIDLFLDWHPLGILWSHRDDIFGVFESIREGITDRIDGAITWLTQTAPGRFRGALLSLKEMIVDLFADMGDLVTEQFRDAWNAAIGGRGFDIPEIEIEPVTIAGETLFEGATIGGQSIRIPELQTGGLIGDVGTAALHPGERVLPPAQVTERGEASFDPSSVADGFDRSRNADTMVRLLRQLLRAVESTPPPRGTRGDDPGPFA